MSCRPRFGPVRCPAVYRFGVRWLGLFLEGREMSAKLLTVPEVAEIPGRKRLAIDHGKPINEIIA